MIKLKTQFKVRVVYKSGYVQDFWCNSFSIQNGTWKWDAAGSVTPVMLGVDDIAAVWTLATRRRFDWGTK
jgi:hypothetical protein